MTSSPDFHVLVIGGGIGGLCLAQGLRKAGLSVSLCERDRTRTDRLDRYRLHISPAGSRSLHACLPERLWQSFLAGCGEPGGGFGFLTEQLATLVVVEDQLMYPDSADPAEKQYPVDRMFLRQVLLDGLNDVVQFGKRFKRYELRPDGKVIAFFADGTTCTADVLVGADGANSAVRHQYLPSAETLDTETVGVGLTLPLNAQTRTWMPARLATGMNMIIAPAPYLFSPPSSAGQARRAQLVGAHDPKRPTVTTSCVPSSHVAMHCGQTSAVLTPCGCRTLWSGSSVPGIRPWSGSSAKQTRTA